MTTSIQTIVLDLKAHVRATEPADLDLDTVEFLRRLLRNVARDARRAQREAAGVTPEATIAQNTERETAVREALCHLPWTGSYSGGTFLARHLTDHGMLTVASPDLPGLLHLIETVDTARRSDRSNAA